MNFSYTYYNNFSHKTYTENVDQPNNTTNSRYKGVKGNQETWRTSVNKILNTFNQDSNPRKLTVKDD